MSEESKENPRLDNILPTSLMREKKVLQIIPVSRSCWWQGVRNGIFPQPVRISKRITAWRSVDIQKIVDEGPLKSIIDGQHVPSNEYPHCRRALRRATIRKMKKLRTKLRMMWPSMEGTITTNESITIYWNMPIGPIFQSRIIFTSAEISGLCDPYGQRPPGRTRYI